MPRSGPEDDYKELCQERKSIRGFSPAVSLPLLFALARPLVEGPMRMAGFLGVLRQRVLPLCNA